VRSTIDFSILSRSVSDVRVNDQHVGRSSVSSKGER